jgi:hypothetical protein
MGLDLSGLVGNKVVVLVGVGAKGLVKAKGVLAEVSEDGGLIAVESEGGGLMGGGKKKVSIFSLYSVLGLEFGDATMVKEEGESE